MKVASRLLLSALLSGTALSVANLSAMAQSPDPAARRAFFGDLHLHTSYSFDAWAMMGTKATPDDAYRFAQGETINYLGKPVHRSDPPLDFMAVTDHSEFLGALRTFDDPNSALARDSAAVTALKKDPISTFFRIFRSDDGPHKVLGVDVTPNMRDAWQDEINAANSNYRPGKFTTFIAYEWSSMPDGRYNLHRNVIFSGDHAPMPFSSVDSERPEDLWTYLEDTRAQGTEVIAIPHNANASGGLMFDWVNSDGKPIDEVYAQRRATNEPLTEIYQTKGSSETIPELSSADEFSNFEIMDKLLIAPVKSAAPGSYVRDAEGRGLVLQQKLGVNPYKLGFVAASDHHNGLSTSAEGAFAGGANGNDPSATLPTGDAAKRALAPQPAFVLAAPDGASAGSRPTVQHPPLPFDVGKFTDPTNFGSAGLTGVWAEENTRPAIFAAFQRKETFATSGTHLKIRFFGSWNYAKHLPAQADWVKTAYAEGVPMGGDLPGSAHGAPKFLVWAAKDPDGANLDRVQIVKVWLQGKDYKEKVFDVAVSDRRKIAKSGHAAALPSTVDLKTGTYKNSVGASELSTVWQDPSFNPKQAAVYYARALEIATPRWTTLLAVKNNLPLPDNGRPTLQERAWASPIWYTPEKHS